MEKRKYLSIAAVSILALCFLMLLFAFIATKPSNSPKVIRDSSLLRINKSIIITQGKNYYVSPSGDNSNEGTSLEKPLKTIKVAVEKMKFGDVCYLRKGKYNETVTITKPNVTFKNYNNETAVVSGLDPVEKWSRYKGNIYKAVFIPEEKDEQLEVAWHLKGKGKYFTQVFADDELMTEARYPNHTGDILNWEEHGGDVKIFLDGKFTFLKPAKNWPENYWKGAIMHAIVERKFTAVQGLIKNHSAGEVIGCSEFSTGWKNSTAASFAKHLFTAENNTLTGIGKGFITHHLNALDAEREWFWEKNSNTLYFQAPGNVDPNSLRIEAKSRKYAFVISNTENVRIEGIHIHGAGVEIINSNYCVIESARITYPMPFYYYAQQDEYNGKASIDISGNGNLLKNCYIGHVWGSGILIREGIKNTVENSLIEDVDWMGTYNSCIKVSGDQTQIIRNTLRRSGRFLIEGVGVRKGKIAYNNMYDGMLIGQDGGGYYTHVTDGDQTEIAFNWVHDIVGIPFERSEAKDHNLSIGIYLDGGCQNYNVHHNVIWNIKYGVMLNVTPGLKPKTASGNRIDYNTIVARDVAVLSKELPLMYFNNSAKHNLGNRKVAALIKKDSNIVDTSGSLEKLLPENKKTQNSATRQNMNTNRKASPESTTSNDPDAGAYERKVKQWKAGADTLKIPMKRTPTSL